MRYTKEEVSTTVSKCLSVSFLWLHTPWCAMCGRWPLGRFPQLGGGQGPGRGRGAALERLRGVARGVLPRVVGAAAGGGAPGPGEKFQRRGGVFPPSGGGPWASGVGKA